MKVLLYHVVSVLLLTVFPSISECFRIRRSSLSGYSSPYGLSSDYVDMGRPRRGNYRTLSRNILTNEDDSLFNPNSISNLDDDYLRELTLDNEIREPLPVYAYERPFQSYAAYEDIPLQYSHLRPSALNPIKRRAYSPRRRVPTFDELRSLFGEAEVPPMKRLVPVKRQEPVQEGIEEKTETDKIKTEKIMKDKVALANEWGKLINAAEKLTKEEVSVSDRAEKISEDMALNDIFRDAQTETENKDVAEEKESIQENKIELTGLGNTDKTLTKSKRASSSEVGDTSDYILSLLKQIEELKQKVINLELLQMLEDRENDFLADALKYATLDQIHESDDLVSDEYNNIAKATETEELIQQVSAALEGQEEEEEQVVGMEELPPPVDVKRSDQEGIKGEQWLEEPVHEKVGLGAILEEDNGGSDDLGTEEPIDIPFPDDDDDEEEEEEEEAAEEVAEELAEEEKEEKIKNEEVVLAKLISSLSPVTIREIIQDLKGNGPQEEIMEDEVCPAVNELSQNCAFADERHIPIDEEARNLCIRHQICYTCGQALGIPSDNCDGGYKETAITECNGDVNCVRSAAFFLQLMKSRFHTYEEYSPKECQNMCVADFIYGVE